LDLIRTLYKTGADGNMNLHSTCRQRWLNFIAMSRIHKDVVDSIDDRELMKEFVLLRGSRTLRSGRFSFKATVYV